MFFKKDNLKKINNNIKILQSEKFELSKIAFRSIFNKDTQIKNLQIQISELKKLRSIEQMRADEIEKKYLILEQQFLKSQKLVRKYTKPPPGYPPKITLEEQLQNENLILKELLFNSQQKLKTISNI